jgi:hypothetical protein
MSRHDGAAALLLALEAARRRAGHGALLSRVELYCEGPACPVRTVVIEIKATTGDPTPGILHCPACSAPLQLHDVLTAAEADDAARRSARSSVHEELYVARERRRRGDPDALVAVPLAVFPDESLPGIDA